jgi:hypothetical protein
MEEAITDCLNLIPNYRSFLMTSGKSNISETGAIILEDLLANAKHEMSRKHILREHWSSFDAELMDKAVATLEQAGLLQTITNSEGIMLRLTSKCMEVMGKSSTKKGATA